MQSTLLTNSIILSPLYQLYIFPYSFYSKFHSYRYKQLPGPGSYRYKWLQAQVATYLGLQLSGLMATCHSNVQVQGATYRTLHSFEVLSIIRIELDSIQPLPKPRDTNVISKIKFHFELCTTVLQYLILPFTVCQLQFTNY